MPHTVEEAYEVADAALAGTTEAPRRARRPALPVVLPCAPALRAQASAMEAVARNVHGKLIARHPHVFGDVEATTAERVRENWERLKVDQEARKGIFHDVPATLPALLLARKVQRRAAAPASTPMSQVRSEISTRSYSSLRRAAGAGRRGRARCPGRRRARRFLFACVNVARRLNVDPSSSCGGCRAFPRAGRGGRTSRGNRRRELVPLWLSRSRTVTSTSRRRST